MDYIIDFIDNDMQFEEFSPEQLAHLKEEARKLGVQVRKDAIDEREFYSIKKSFADLYNKQKRMERTIAQSIKDTIDEIPSKMPANASEIIEEIIEEFTSDTEYEVKEVAATNETNNQTTVEDETMNNKTTGTVNNETVNNTIESMEDTTMNNTNTNGTVNAEEVTMADKAKAFAEASKEKLAGGFKFVVENIDVAADEVTKMSNMNSEELEEYLKDNSESIFSKIMGSVKDFRDRMKSKSGSFPSFAKHAETSDNIIKLVKEVLDDEEINGWGKFKEIVKALIKWVVRLFIKVGAIVLKVALVIVVGGVKIACTIIATTIRAASVLNKEVVKPTVKVAKKEWADHKVRKAAKEAAMNNIEEEAFEDFGEEIELV